MRSTVLLLVLFLLCFVVVPDVLAHAPLDTGTNENITSATIIPDPVKSWAIYATLHEGNEAQYYRFDINAGQRIHISLFTTTTGEDAAFSPAIALMGEDIPVQGAVPAYVQVPPGARIMAVSPVRASYATYEAFAPSSFVGLAEISWDATATGTYYLAVYDPVQGGGNYGIAIGDQESFTPAEWIQSPLALLNVYQWERQDLFLVLAPAAIILVVGILLILTRKPAGTPLDLPGWFGAVAGLLFLGTGATLFTQMTYALLHAPPDPLVVVTFIFIMSSVILGLATLRHAFLHARIWTFRHRIILAILGLLALIAWSGYIVGPALAVIASALPSGKLR